MGKKSKRTNKSKDRQGSIGNRSRLFPEVCRVKYQALVDLEHDISVEEEVVGGASEVLERFVETVEIPFRDDRLVLSSLIALLRRSSDRLEELSDEVEALINSNMLKKPAKEIRDAIAAGEHKPKKRAGRKKKKR